jgi:hypothetical protein
VIASLVPRIHAALREKISGEGGERKKKSREIFWVGEDGSFVRRLGRKGKRRDGGDSRVFPSTPEIVAFASNSRSSVGTGY